MARRLQYKTAATTQQKNIFFFMLIRTTPLDSNRAPRFSISAIQQNDSTLSVNVTNDQGSSSIIIDIISPDNRNTIVRMLNRERQIIKIYSWYLMKGRNVTTIKNYDQLDTGLYNLQIMKIGGDIIFSGRITLSPALKYPLLRFHL